MVYKIYKVFLKIVSSFALKFLNILLVSFILFYSESAFSKVYNIEKNLAYKYCDSIKQNLFKGLDNEKVLKYKYLFSSLNKELIKEEKLDLTSFSLKVESLCSYSLSIEEKEDMKKMLNKFLSNN
tara:strand:- start:496 stop:870 length:375 start_codon:yes stop_codon:yes gene_type:complete